MPHLPQPSQYTATHGGHPLARTTMGKYASGFSLVEIMVGMIIGLLGMIVIMNVYSVFEGQKRSTSGGSEAQDNGAIALMELQRDIQQAGYDFSSPQAIMGCSLTLRAGVALPALAPITINPPTAVIPAGDANTDTLLIVYGDDDGKPEGDDIITIGPVAAATPTVLSVKSPNSFSINDNVVAMPAVRPSPCNLSMDQVVGTNSTSVTLLNGVSSANYPILPSVTGTLYNLGNANDGRPLKALAYAIRGSILTVCDYATNNCGDPALTSNTTVWLPIGNDIVSLSAQYGRDISGPPMDGIVDQYDQATPASASATYVCDWTRISAIRIALVARNSQRSGAQVTTTPLIWSGGVINLTGTNGMLPAGATWQDYRYKVFETSIPLRNISALGVIPGC